MFVELVVAAALAQPAAQPAATTTVKLFFVALEDAGRSGAKIGCDDSLVAVNRTLPQTTAPLRASIAELLSVRDERDGASGLYNALAKSHLTIDRVTIVNGVADIRLTGDLSLGGTCDAPRVEAQLQQVALQFPTVKRADFFVNGVPLADVLSGR